MAKKNKQDSVENNEIVKEQVKEIIGALQTDAIVTIEDELPTVVMSGEIPKPIFDLNLAEEVNQPEVEEQIIDEPVMEKPVVEVNEIKPIRTLDSLSKDEYRNYQRTGKLPE